MTTGTQVAVPVRFASAGVACAGPLTGSLRAAGPPSPGEHPSVGLHLHNSRARPQRDFCWLGMIVRGTHGTAPRGLAPSSQLRTALRSDFPVPGISLVAPKPKSGWCTPDSTYGGYYLEGCARWAQGETPPREPLGGQGRLRIGDRASARQRPGLPGPGSPAVGACMYTHGRSSSSESPGTRGRAGPGQAPRVRVAPHEAPPLRVRVSGTGNLGPGRLVPVVCFFESSLITSTPLYALREDPLSSLPEGRRKARE